MRREQLDLDAGEMHVNRSKKGKPSTHPIPGSELRALRRFAETAEAQIDRLVADPFGREKQPA